MKYLIASDIHGSFYYCEQLVRDFVQEDADRLILLGDILYHGPRNDLPYGYAPKKVISLLNPLKDKIIAVRGNCDAEVDQMVLDFEIMADYKLLAEDGLSIFLTHGHVYNNDHLPAERFDILLHGHTHIPVCEDKGNYFYMNPGSVSIPKNGSAHSYILMEDRNFLWKDLGDGTVLMEKKL